MGKQSIAIAIISIIFGVFGVGFGIFTMMNFQVQLDSRKGVVNTWYDKAPTLISIDSSFSPIPDLSIEFIVNAGENVYISYNGNSRLTSTQAEFKICINNHGQEYAEIDSSIAGDIMKVCVSIQCVNNTLDPGNYTATVWAREEVGASCTIAQSTLFVQTFIP